MNDDWYLDEEFWATFGSLMFNEETFAEGTAQVGALLDLIDRQPGRALDLGCGPGRHALPLAAQGYPVTAVDTSTGLLEDLERHRGDLPIETVKADMRAFVRPETFDLVLVMWSSFGYFTEESDHEQVLANIHRSLTPDGQLVLDLVGLEYLCRNLEPVHLTEYDDGRILIERPELTDDLTRLDNDWMLIDGDQVARTHFSHRVWSAGEIRALLTRCGFTSIRLYGSYEGDEYDLDSERLIVVAGKGG